jgi:signal transduction histidine kinase
MRLSWWVGKGVVAMAILAAAALAVTVLFTRRALDEAADVVVLGDGEALVADIVAEFWEEEWPPTSKSLAAVLARHDAQRLRYIALVGYQDHDVVAEAGHSAITRSSFLSGEVEREGQRVRLVAIIPPPWETRAAKVSLTPASAVLPMPRPRLVIEFEPPLIESLRRDVTQISAVAALAALVLVAFALAWSRTMNRLEAVEQQAETERRLLALGGASSVIAHELRNPLAALKGHAQLLLEDLSVVAEPARAKAARVVEGAERLEGLTTMLLDFVRDAPLDVADVAPADLIDRALETLPKDRVRVDLSKAGRTVHVDVARMSVALRNLVQNALQADEAQPIEVRIIRDAREAVLEVRDHGPGLPHESGVQIFDPFVTTKVRGTGLGLSIARRIADQHHGSLTGETHREGGAVFRLAFPA